MSAVRRGWWPLVLAAVMAPSGPGLAAAAEEQAGGGAAATTLPHHRGSTDQPATTLPARLEVHTQNCVMPLALARPSRGHRAGMPDQSRAPDRAVPAVFRLHPEVLLLSEERGAVRLRYATPTPSGSSYLYLDLFSGDGESLETFKQERTRLGIGFAILR